MWIRIIAIYEEQESPILSHNGRDGTSASSVRAESPDMFMCEENPHLELKEFYSENDVVITASDISSGLTPLYVRRESEPALNSLSSDVSNVDSTKQWSAAVTVAKEASETLNPLIKDDKAELNGVFSRTGQNLGKCTTVDSSSNILEGALNGQLYRMQDGRNEPLGELGTSAGQSRDRCIDLSVKNEDRQNSVILKNESGPLGIHVISDYDLHGRGMGIKVQGIEPGGRIDQDGRLCVGDRIISINGKSLFHVSFQKAQELFKDALKEPQVKIQLAKSSLPIGCVERNEERPLCFYTNFMVHKELSRNEHQTIDLVDRQKQEGLKTNVSSVETSKEIRPSLTLSQNFIPLISNTRKIGQKILIHLMKGPFGFGFSITTRDNPAGGNCPIYVKNILPKGAAVQDGRLNPGDRILEVNGVEMTGLSQTEAVRILKNIPQGEYVNLVVSRQERIPAISHIRSQDVVSKKRYKLPHQVGNGSGIEHLKHREILTFCIPLNDTRLGICVKGKISKTANGPVDLGIFVKDIICGGAASKDGRLRTNDQLVKINDISLLRRTNMEAMEILHQVDDPVVTPNAIMLTIARQMSSFDRNVDPLLSLTGQRNVTFSSSRNFLKEPTSSLENRSSSSDNSTSENLQSTMSFIPNMSITKCYHVERGNENIREATSTNQLSVDVESHFSLTRDGIGRRSMSEKRFARLNARHTDNYQRNKRARDEPKEQNLLHTEEQEMSDHKNQEKQGEFGTDGSEENGPSLGLKKSSSIERLSNVAQEQRMENQDRAPHSSRPMGVIRRGHICNASFRAAVDHSYEGPVSETLETLNEETDSSSEVTGIYRRDVSISDFRYASSVDSGLATKETTNESYKTGKTRRKKRLLQGLGSVFNIQEHYRKAVERQRQEEWEQTYSKESFGPALHLLPRTRQKNKVLLVAKHQQWSGHYHVNGQEERQKNDILNNFEIDKEVKRQRNISGVFHPSKYGHYVNYKEVQHQLLELGQNQLKNPPHQKQRGKSSTGQKIRPVSNYFDYGSKKVLFWQSSNQQNNELETKSLPHRSKMSTRPRIQVCPTY
ncbi:partitioning defective 3 homolog isoform X3 [Tachypleus tridentatus]|uniref:partitioning defective 3 homolog isoform X3 n=1 Tax=Tachypleus tridentatus TaxID=6853 RepID=UPI003FCFA598